MTERHLSQEKRRRALAGILLAILFCTGGPLLALDWSVPSGALDHKMVTLSHVTPERAKELLTKLKLGTANRMPGTNSLLITGEADILRKALVVLALVDAPQQYDVAQLGQANAASTLPTNDRIADAVGGITIGTFAHPPVGIEKTKVLIDAHDGVIMAVAPVFQLQDIRLAVELGPEAVKQRKETARHAQASVAATTPQATDVTPAPAASTTVQAGKTPSPQASASQAATQPVSAAVPEPAPVSSASSLGQADDANELAGLVRAGAPPQDVAPGQPTTPKPQTSESTTLQPGQVVPPELQPIPTPEKEAEIKTPKAGPPTPVRAATGTSNYEPAAFPNGDQEIKLTLPERLPVIQLIDLVGKYLNLSYVYDPAKVTGEVTLKLNGNLQGSMKVKDLYLLLESVLQFKDLVMTRHKGNIVKIVPKAEITAIDPELVSPEKTTVEAGDAIVTRVFTLKHIDTASAENLLNTMGLAACTPTSMAESGTVIVTAYAHRMDRIERLLEMVDKPGVPRQFKFRQLRYTMAQALAEKVKALAEQLESVTVTVGGDATGSTASAAAARLPGESEAAWRARLVRIKQAEANAAAIRRQPGMPVEPKPGVYLDADERTNRILMIGIAEQLEIVEHLVDTLDVEQQDLRSLELYRILHVDADEVARKLQELGIISKVPESTAPGRITGSSRTAMPTAAATQPRPATPTPEIPMISEVTEAGVVGEPQVVVVESTNSLLVNATAEQHATIATIIEYVDSETDVTEMPYKIYPLENSTPDHLAEVFENLIQETIEQQNKEGKIEKTVIGRDERVKIVPDPNTYSLVVYASKKNQEWIANLIKQLDKRRPQVLIDVTLVEVTNDDTFTYDLQLIENWPNVLNPSGVGPTVSSTVLPKLQADPDRHFVEAGSSQGTLTGYYADRHVSALLTAMQEKKYGRVLAKPKLLVNDNEPGTIKTGETRYVEKRTQLQSATQQPTAGQDFVTSGVDFEPYEAAIEMNITPHISEGDLLRLVVELKRSDFLSPDTLVPGAKPPTTVTSEVNTAVTVPDGSTIILGGMLKLSQNKNGQKVPILGDIPLIGGLFRTINNSNRDTKLYVFVKAEIIRPAGTHADGMEDLVKISEVNRTAFEKHELEFQNHQSWPGVKSKPVNPPKVLDAD